MHAAGDPGTKTDADVRGLGLPPAPSGSRAGSSAPVERDDHLPPKRYESGLVLSVEGAFHPLDNQVRGYGTRDFPAYEHTVAPEPVEMPVEPRLIAELGAVLAANGLERLVRYRPVR